MPSAINAVLSNIAKLNASGALSGQRANNQTNSIRDAGGNTPSSIVKLSSYGKAQTAFNALKQSSKALANGDLATGFKTESDEQLVRASARSGSKPRSEVKIDITQLAQAQNLQSQLFSSATSSLGSGSLQIDFGRINASSGEFVAQTTSSKINISATDATLEGVANAINRANIGIKASISNEQGQVRLNINGQQSGSNQAFQIRVQDADGNDLDQAQGLSRLAFDPAAQSGQGRNLQVNSSAQDAKLSIDGSPLISSSNLVEDGSSGLNLDLKSVGSGTISSRLDPQGVINQTKQLVTALNDFRDQIGKIDGDGLTRRGLSRIDNALNQTSSSQGLNQLSLLDAGISLDRQGKLSVDEAKRDALAQSNPEGLSNLLRNLAHNLSRASENSEGEVSRVSSQIRQNNSSLSRRFTVNPAPATTLLNYQATTQSLNGLAQYLSVANF